MKFIDSTYEILYLKINDIYSERYVDWAIDMLETGFDSEHLRILAGAEKPYNAFYLRDIFNNVCKELHIDLPNENEIITEYHKYLMSLALEKKRNAFDVLSILYDYSLSYNKPTERYMPFWLLYHAWGELKDMERYPDLRNHLVPNHYWEEATTQNIESIVLEEFRKWKTTAIGI